MVVVFFSRQKMIAELYPGMGNEGHGAGDTTGLGLAFNNAMDLMGFAVIGENSHITVELLRGPAVMGADNDPTLIPLQSNDTFTVHAEHNTPTLYGLDVFRCMDCYDLRKNGIRK